MSPMAPTARIQRPLRTMVYTRRAADGALPVDGDSEGGGGWVLDPNLRCDRVGIRTGARSGVARFTYVPEPTLAEPFEKILARYTSDDQVRVEVYPLDDISAESPGDARVLFEGVLTRHQIETQADGASSREVVRFVGLAFPWLDDALSCHLVRGRWVAPIDLTGSGTGSSGGFFMVESPDLPPVFNFNGAPNRHPTATITCGGGVSLTAPVFTHDTEPDGVFWTVREALTSILVMCLYGPTGTALPRHIDLEEATAAALNVGASAGDRPDGFIGLDAQLPEVNVYGMGVLEAFGAVCRAGGFEFAVEPEAFAGGTADRGYQLRIWRRNSGSLQHLDLDKSASTYATPEQALARNDISKLNAVRDGAEIVNEVFGMGRVLIEAALILRPLWNPIEVDPSAVTSDLQDATKDQLNGSGYHSKHLPNGSQFDLLGHVGRMWGLDCIGGYDGYPAYPYQQPPDGMDFVGELNLSTSAPALKRAALGITDPIRWTKRIRQALPLRNATAKANGIQYVLDVSEDAGATWSPCSIRFQTLGDPFAVYLSVKNLAAINNEAIGTGVVPEVSESWWQLIKDQKLLFSLACSIEADHGLRFDATHRSTSGSRYKRGQMMVLPVDQVWVHTSSPFSESADVTVFGASDNSVRDAVERRRDAAEDARVAATAATWVMDLDRFRLGDRVSGVRGRDYSFAVNSGEAESFPNIVGITYQLGATGQSIRLSLHDHRVIGGTA